MQSLPSSISGLKNLRSRLGHSATFTLPGGGVTPVPPILTPTATPVFASSRLRHADRTGVLTGTFLTSLHRVPAVTPNRTIKNPRVFIPGFYSNNAGSSPTERMIANNFDIAYALEIVGTGLVRKRATFAGANWTTRGGTGASKGQSTPFDAGILSDEIKNADGSDLVIPANSSIAHCSLVRLAATGHLFPGSQVATTAIGGAARNNADGTGAVLEPFLTNATAIGAVGSGPVALFAPAYMVGTDVETGELISVLLSGDSRFYGVGDYGSGVPASEPAGSLQAGQRAMATLRLPHANIAIPGSTPYSDTVHRYASVKAIANLYGGKQAFTYAISNHGNNGDMNVAGIQQELAELKVAFPQAGIKFGKATLPPRIGTGGDYRTLSGQTPAAQDQYPSGVRAQLNEFILANTKNGAPLWDFVIDMGLYGSAAKGMMKTDASFNEARSKFPFGPSTTMAKAWTNTNTIYLSDQSIRPGDLIMIGAAFNRSNIIGPINAGPVDNGDGTWRYGIENGGYPNTTYAIGDPVTRVASADGTHEATWVSVLESQAIIEWFNGGRPARYPVA